MSTVAGVASIFVTLGYVVIGVVYVVGIVRRSSVPFELLWAWVGCALAAVVLDLASGRTWLAMGAVFMAVNSVICLSIRMKMQERGQR